MNFDEIKEIIEIDGGKFIIVENGKPVMVITSFEEYKRKLKESGSKKRTLDNLQLSNSNNPSSKSPRKKENEELKIEDLPF